MTARWRWGLLVLLLPFVLVAIESRLVATSMGDAIARHLREATRVLERRPRIRKDARVVSWTPDVVTDAGAADPAKAGIVDRALVTPTTASTSDRARPPAPSAPLFIPATAVQHAVDDDGHTIHARTTLGPDGKPAGARLTGISSAGLGLYDGDVIVGVDGTPTMDDDAATDAALRAVARGDSRLHATLTRDGQAFQVVLELPFAPADAGNGHARR